MADGRIEIETEINTDGVDKGLKNVTSKLNGFGSKLKNADFMKLGAAVAGIGVAFKAVTTAVKTTVKSVKELEAAYKKQKNAEVQLNVAVKNSPLMNGESAKKMRELASEIQKVSTYGDEELLPFFTQLINSGRSEAETMDIMRAAVDVAASGMMDLGSAVSALNMTFQGNAGTLGRQISGIKNLTTEELKAGKAVQIIKAQFAGTAEEVAKATGSAEQLANAWGDLREEMGAGWEKPLSKVRTWLQDIIDKSTEALRKQREIREADERIEAGKGTTGDYLTQIETLTAERDKLTEEKNVLIKKSKGEGLTDEDIITYINAETAAKAYGQQLDQNINRYFEVQNELVKLTKEYNALKDAEEAEAKAKAAATEAERKEAERLAANAESTKRYYEIIKKRNETVDTLKREAEIMGEEVDQQEVLNAYMSAYLEMAKDPNLGARTAEHLAEVQAMAEAYKKTVDEAERVEELQTMLNDIDFQNDIKKSDILKEQLKTLDEIYTAVMDNATAETLATAEKERLAQEYADKRKQLAEEITKTEQEELEKQKLSLNEIIETVNTAINQVLETINSITAMFTARNEAETERSQLELEKKYRDGLVDEKEYYKQKDKLEKDAARKQYDIQMWEWSASLVQIGVNTAQAITKALAEGGAITGVVMASLIGAMGAAQLAAAIGNKPIPPHFANGGIVPGASYSGDRVTANVNSGEMILNSRQQLALWKTANGQGGNGGGMNVEIKNYAANDTTVTPQFTERGLVLAVRKIVSDDLQNRKLNTPLAAAESTMNGIKYES